MPGSAGVYPQVREGLGVNPVAICLPTVGAHEGRLKRSVASILRFQKTSEVEIYLIDNSPDGVESIEGVAHHIRPGANLGLAGSLEMVRRRSKAEFLWSFQDDVELLCDNLAPLLTLMREQPNLGAVTPVIDRDGMVPANLRAGFEVMGEQGTTLVTWPSSDIPISQVDPDLEFSYVFSSGTLYRAIALAQVGGFNLNPYPLGHIDVDIGLRLSDAGWSAKVCPDARIAHAKSGSTTPALGRVVSRLNSPLMRKTSGTFSFDQDVSALFSDEVVRRMSHLFLEVAGEYEGELRKADERYESEITAMRRTLSWRVTLPLRLVFRFMVIVLRGLRATRAKLVSPRNGDGLQERGAS
jgi:GT2 family glycosyltransferase